MIKRSIKPDWTLSFFSSFFSLCHWHMSSFRLRLFYCIPHVAAQHPDGRGRAIVACPVFQKKVRSSCGRKEGGNFRARASVFCAYGALCVSWGCPSHARIFNQRKFDAVKFTLCSFGASCLSAWKRSQLVDSKPSNASAVYRKADTVIGYWIIPNVRYNMEKKIEDNGPVAWRKLF